MASNQKTSGQQAADGKFMPGNKIGGRFPKGASGNTAGRPRLTKLTDALRQQIAETNPDADDETIAETIAKTLIQLALSGDVQAIKEVFDRTEGKPKQSLDLDVSVQDWRSIASGAGLTAEEFIDESKLYVAELEASLIRE
jgi:hypothetical protein